VFKFLSDLFDDFDRLDVTKPIDLIDDRARNRAEGVQNECESDDADADDGAE
jgi:hypothetical protein